MTKGVIILAALSFVIGATIFSLMVYTLVREEQLQRIKDKSPVVEKNILISHSPHAFGLHLDKTSIDVIVSFVLLVSLLKMIHSVLLLIGIKKNKPSLVVAFLSFECFLCLLLLVTALLEILQLRWVPALATASFTIFMIDRLSMVYSFYEKMEKQSDSNLLLEGADFNDQDSSYETILD